MLTMLLRGGFAANRLRLALTLACIALGVALAGAVHSVHTSALAEIDRAARSLAGSADVEVRGPRNGFDDSWFITVARRPEVLAASPIVELEAAIPGNDRTLRVLGIDPMRAVRLQPAFVARAAMTGAGEATALLDPQQLWLTPAAAARFNLRAGGELALVTGSGVTRFTVAGILAGMQASGEAAVMDIAAAQAAFARLGSITRIDLRLRPGVDVATFRAALATVLPPGVAATEPASLSGRVAAITRAYRVNLDALALVALATGSFLVFSTLALQAARRRQEFALLRALGLTRRQVAGLLALEGALIGLLGSLIGTGVGLALSVALLRKSGADLGAGFFATEALPLVADVPALAGIALLGTLMSVAGALWVARAVGRIEVAEALRDRSIDLPSGSGGAAAWSLGLVLAGIPALFAPPVGELPLGGYAAIALWLAAAVIAVGPVCRLVLGRSEVGGMRYEVQLALAQVRHLPGHLAASVAGIVVSASLCVAMAIMVFSFRVSLEHWLDGVIGADVYVRASAGADSGFFTDEEQRRIAALPEVRSAETVRFDRVVLDPARPPVTVVARPIDARILEGFQAEPPGMPPAGDVTQVWISEAARDLNGWKTGERITLPMRGRAVRLQVAGVIRDYARTWGAVLMRTEDYRRITGDMLANDVAIHLAPGFDSQRAEAAIRAALPQAKGMLIEDAADLKRRSLAIFDRSFTVTYALEAIAIVIGLAGVTSSFAALAWSRRREFGVLRFLGLTRREILGLLAWEGAATGALGAFMGLASGIAISLVLIHVVNRQSFHWSLEVHWPVTAIVLFLAAVIALCAVGARVSGAAAVRDEAVLAVKDDA
jgi:putative ABC transport system permease protein